MKFYVTAGRSSINVDYFNISCIFCILRREMFFADRWPPVAYMAQVLKLIGSHINSYPKPLSLTDLLLVLPVREYSILPKPCPIPEYIDKR
jgi:hypothetical protein